MAAVYADDFNIYAAINKLKKKMNRKDPFPDEVLIGVCDSYWNNKPGIKKRWPWFVAAMEYQTRLFICDAEEAKNAEYKKQPMAESIKQIMRRM